MAELGMVEIIGLISIPAAGIILATILNIITQRSVSRGQFATLLNSLSQDHSKLLEQEVKLDSVESCFNYSLSYIDLLNRIAYLCINKKMSKDIGDYFDKFFEYVQLMMAWYDDTVFWDQKTPAKERWHEIIEWCKDRGFPEDKDRGDLPIAMKIIWDRYDVLNLKIKYPRYFEIKEIKRKKILSDPQRAEFENYRIEIREEVKDIDKEIQKEIREKRKID